MLLVSGCSTSEESQDEKMRRINQKGEYVYRHNDEVLFTVSPPTKKAFEQYPWEVGNTGKYPKITKEFFKCKGNNLNPPRIMLADGKETTRCYDCGGGLKHSLPLRDGKEFIYPILIDLMNHVQTKTGKRVVITSGHRCPEHNAYVDSTPENQYSKHMIGAEVSFYVQGLENSPEQIVKILMEYYKGKKEKDLQEFKRYEKKDTNVSISPWYNQEVFIKLFGKKEGRNFDNRHPYAYISVQVRFDAERKEKVTYSWDKAFKNFHRL